MVLPMAEMMGRLRKGVSELVRQAGLQVLDLLISRNSKKWWGSAATDRQIERPADGAANAVTVSCSGRRFRSRGRECGRRMTRKCGWAAMKCSIAASR